jgi:hypothetical protein
MAKRILLVGHCGVDGPMLQREIASQIGAADALRVNSMDDLCEACDAGADLLLVNREPVGFTPLMGIDLVRQLCQTYPHQKVMLVSDHAEAQEEATRAGALPGFGKADVDSPKFAEAICGALGD